MTKKKLIMSVQFDKLLCWANQNLMESSPQEDGEQFYQALGDLFVGGQKKRFVKICLLICSKLKFNFSIKNTLPEQLIINFFSETIIQSTSTEVIQFLVDMMFCKKYFKIQQQSCQYKVYDCNCAPPYIHQCVEEHFLQCMLLTSK